ncbi:nuclear transport factor 2 family protein [Pseudoalteromonas xiamenensis]|uniref:nuclear transport factor 2 family protein n=1 Tax=Pseudoalteromonas xiamenensis TaxID=882626 RepID=UPI0035EFE307
MKRFLGLILVMLCASVSANDSLQSTVDAYFSTYAKRTDFETFMAFYAEEAILKDVVYGYVAKNKAQIASFFDWSSGQFSTLDSQPTLTITQQMINQHSVVTKGTFNAFSFNGKTMGPWEFVIWQEFNASGKIVLQEDWINYTPKKIMVGE